MIIERKKLSEKVIKSAVNGDESSIEIVVKQYEPYMKRLATESHQTEYGTVRSGIDNSTYYDLKIHLIESILKFEIE